MSRYLKKLVSLPVRSLAEYLIDRFLGKFVGKIDLTREGTHFDKETLTLPDLNLNCRVLNESMQHTPLKFVKFHIGTLNLKMLNLRNGQVLVNIKDVQIDLEIQNETFANTHPQNGSSQEQKTQSSRIGITDRRRELFLVDMLVSNVLTNLEINLENLAIRIVTREAQSLEEKVPTFLIRTHAISFSSHSFPKEKVMPPAAKIDPLLPMSDLQCLLGNKKFSISDISIHLMREKWLDPLEHFKVGQFNTHFNAFSFPFDYPTLNHPSTILLIKAPLGIKELLLINKLATAQTVSLREGYDFLPAIQVQFKQNEPGHLSCALEIPLIEAQVSVGQLSEILRVIEALKQKPGQPCKPSQQEIHVAIDEPSGVENFKADFANSVLKQNPELMASMHEMFETQQQDYLIYSSMYDSNVTAPANSKIFNTMGTSSADFRTAPLIGKGDGYSQESALKDSMHPDMLTESIGQKSEAQRIIEEEASFNSSNASKQPTQSKLPVKQPLNQITIEFRLGEFLSTVLGSQEAPSPNQERDGLDQVLDELIHEQGARNKEASPSEASPFAPDHDRVFKAFGEQVNSEHQMQKFHLPERVKQDSSQIKSQWFEVQVQDFNVALQIKREEDVVTQMKIIGEVKNIICQRIDAILHTNQKRLGLGDASAAGNSSLMDMTLLSSDSDKFHSCYTHGNESTVYHDMSQFGMGSMVIAESVNPTNHQQAANPNKIKNLFTFSQLTNLVSLNSQMGSFHVCRSILFEVVKLKRDSQKCLQFSSIKNLTKEGAIKHDSKVLLGKVFANISQSEALLALSMKPLPEMEVESNITQDQVRPQEQKMSLGVQIDGLELDFQFSLSGERVMDILEILTKQISTVQEVLAQVSCKCSQKDAKSVGFNTTQINLVIVPDKEPSCKLKQADLVAKITGQSAPITLFTVHNFIVKASMQETSQKEERQSNISADQNSRMINQKDDSPILFHRTSSSYDEVKGEEERKSQMRQSFHYNSSVVHLIDEPCHVQIIVRVQQLAILMDHRDLLGPIADYFTSIEGQVKNLLNVIDTFNVVSTSKIKDTELFFIAKRDKVCPSIQVTTIVDDLTIQALYGGIEAVKLRLDKTNIDFKMQDRGSLANFALSVKMHDFIIIDQIQKVHAYYKIGTGNENNEQPHCKLYKSPIRYLSLLEETEHSSEFLLVHSSQELHSRPLFTCDVQISFLNQAYMEERILLEDLRRQIVALISNKEDGQRACRQISLDFSEMKKNPAQLVCSGVISHLTINISNQNLALSQTLSKVAKKAGKVLGKLRSKKGLVDFDESRKLEPRASPILQQNFEESQLNLQLRDLTLIYTPVLSRAQLTSAFGSEPNDDFSFDYSKIITSEMKKDFDQQLFRLNRHIALHLNHLQTEVVPKEKKFELRVRSLALHFLTENCHSLSKSQLENWQKKFQIWRLQGRQSTDQKCSTSQQELQRRGFVPLVALNDFIMVFKRMQLAVKLNSVSLSFAEDSLHDFISFLKLVQVSIGDDLVRFEDTMDQQVSMQDSLITLSGGANTTTYQGQGLDKSQLSLIKEQSMIHDESVMLTRNEQSVKTSKISDEQPSVLFGDEHPFCQMADDQDMFIVSITTTQQPSRRHQAQNNPFARIESLPNRICLLKMVDPNYFAQPAESQSKLDQQRYRKIHDLTEQMRRMVCSLSFSFELGSLRLVLFCGKDFAFDNTTSSSNSKKPKNVVQRNLEKFIAQSTANHSLGLAKTMQDRGNSRFFSGTSRQQSQAVNRETIARSRVSRIGASEDKQVMLLEDNYIDENELAEEQPEEYSRARTDHRKHNLFTKLEIQDLLVTRRHFPDQVCLDERKVNKKETPKKGLKFKTFALSARDFQINFSHAKGSKYLLESPYSFRHHNIIELSVQSEKSYEKNIEEHSILLFLRPSKVTIDRETIDFIDKMLKVTLAQSMEGLKATKGRDDEFDVIEDEEVKEAEQPARGQLFESNQNQNCPEKKLARTQQLIRNLVIKETSLTLSVSLTKLISFQNLTIPIREFRLQNTELSQFLVVDQAPGLPILTVQNYVVKFYTGDIIRNQKLAILKSFRPVQGLTFFGGSILSPFYKPLLHGYQFGLNGFLVGLSEGFGDVYTLLAQSTYDWSVYLVQIRRL